MSLRAPPLRLCICLVIAAAIVAPPMRAIAGDSLDKVRAEVEQNDKPRDSDDCDDDDSSSVLGQLIGDLFGPPILFVLGSPWWGPHVALVDNLDIRPDFPTAPYIDGVPGHLLIHSTNLTPVRGWGGRAAAHYGTDFGDLQWSTIRLQMDTAPRFGFDAEWTHWTESTRGRNDSLDTGEVNLLYRFAQSEQLEFHTGLGVNWLADGSDGEAGINFTYGMQAFPVRPWTLRAAIDAGTLGDAGLFHFRVGAGAVWNRCELFTGYDVYRIGDVTLDGLFAGAAFWF